jgi:hypothetical protein
MDLKWIGKELTSIAKLLNSRQTQPLCKLAYDRKDVRHSRRASRVRTASMKRVAMADVPRDETEAIMDYEKRGLGKPPFVFIGMATVPSPSLAEYNPEAYKNALKRLPRPTMSGAHVGTCTRCGMPIKYNFMVKNGEGKTFPVGSECILKHDRTMQRQTANALKKEKAKINREKALIVRGQILKILEDEALDKIPHPNEFLAQKGNTIRDWGRFVLDRGSKSGRAKLLKQLQEYQELAHSAKYRGKRKVKPKVDRWFSRHKKEVAEAIKMLKGERFFDKWVTKLEGNERVPDKIWTMIVEEVARRKAAKGKRSFMEENGRSKVKIDGFVVDVKRLKFTVSEMYGTGHVNIMGDSPDYAEFCYIKLSAGTIAKKLGLDEYDVNGFLRAADGEITMTDDYEKAGKKIESKLVKRQVTLKGTFSTNGKMIFGSRVSIKSIA